MNGNDHRYLSLQREVHRKGVVYAWTTEFLNRLHAAAKIDPAIVVEAFGSPREIGGFAEPPIGVARLIAEARA